ncbi:phosphatidylglycerol lysyltransferase domain-containing protein [Nitrospira sp. MA-1]|nr:phosphatidylglycerol lysyltransferase domain-containing protein [Nitrospira sp. MA-1]
MSIHLSPLTLKDQVHLNQAIASTSIGGKTPLSTWSFPPHYIWKDLFTFSWTDIDGWLCLFAEYSDGIFMPLPPVGPCSDSGSSSGSPLKNVLSQVMAYMKIRNRGSHVTRIENIPAALKEEIQGWGYTLTPKDSDYLYRTADLIHLKGNPYKSQRAACNRFIRTHRIHIAPYQSTDREECLALFHRWVHQKENIPISRLGPNEDVARMMLRDSANAHRVTLQEHRELGLAGRIVWVDGAVKAYTFGFPQSSEVFCVLLEIADRSVYGLAQYLFREFCREFQAYPLINTMDDSGLPALARTKLAYHPCQLVPNYIAQPS